MIIPIGNRVLVKVIEDELGTGPGGFARAEGARKDKPLFGEVISVSDNGVTSTMINTASSLSVGDKVYVSSYGYDEIGEFIMVPGDLILGVER
jgi:co-chaperonin GroES (HSP10)